MNLRRPLLLSLAIAALTGAALPSCTTGGDRLVIYSGRDKELIKPLLDRFTEDSDVKIDVRYGDSADLALKINEEGKRSPADVFISQSPGAMGYLDEKDRLGTLPDSLLDDVPDDNHAEDGSWVGLTGRVRVLVYNRDLVSEDELPESIFDLTDPSYQGKVGVAPSNGSFQDFVTALRDSAGDERAAEWLNGMAENDSPTFPNNVSIVEAVAAGDVPMGLANHYYVARAKAEDPDTKAELHFFPEGDPGSLLLVTAAAQLKGTEKGEAAEELISFLLSQESQEYFANETQEYPLAAGVAPDEGVLPLEEITVTRVDLDELGGGLTRTQELIEDSGL